MKTTAVPGVCGDDQGKQVKGRKRHLLVDTLGLRLAVVVTAASVQDRDGARLLLTRLGGACKKLRLIWVAAHCRFHLQGVLRSDSQKGFVLLARRWVVERTLAWLTHCQRLSKDYERLVTTSETMVYIVMIRLMLRRLAHT